MAEIKIPFNDWSKDKLNKQLKNATSRYKKYGKVGDTFEVNGWKYELEIVVKLPLWFISFYLYKSEGCNSSNGFESIWEEIHPRKGFLPFDEVWYHYFKEIC